MVLLDETPKSDGILEAQLADDAIQMLTETEKQLPVVATTGPACNLSRLDECDRHVLLAGVVGNGCAGYTTTDDQEINLFRKSVRRERTTRS